MRHRVVDLVKNLTILKVESGEILQISRKDPKPLNATLLLNHNEPHCWVTSSSIDMNTHTVV